MYPWYARGDAIDGAARGWDHAIPSLVVSPRFGVMSPEAPALTANRLPPPGPPPNPPPGTPGPRPPGPRRPGPPGPRPSPPGPPNPPGPGAAPPADPDVDALVVGHRGRGTLPPAQGQLP